MLVRAIKTRALIPPKDDLLSVIKESFVGVKEKSIIIVTSKVVSIYEGRCVKISEVTSKDELIKKEADLFLERQRVFGDLDVMLTIKNNILIPTAGIDESNANGYYILWPEKPFESAKKIYEFVKKEFSLKEFGVIISDSHTTPLRAGIMGMAISFYGLNPLRNYIGKKDIFGRELKMSQTNIVDSLAATAVYEMGEGKEQTPIAIIEDAGKISFDVNDNERLMSIDINDDIYSPVLKSVKWNKGKK